MNDSYDWYDLVDEELAGVDAATWANIEEVRNSIHNWITRKDPDYMDFLVMFCLQNKLPLTPTMLKFVAQAAEARINRKQEVTKQYRNQSNLAKLGAIDFVMKEMMKMVHFCDLSEDDAAKNGAKIWLSRFHYLKKRPVSTLRQDYISWKSENIDFVDQVKKSRPEGWTKDEVNLYLTQFDSIELKDFQIGVIR